jgi:hypothetical protein
VLAVAACMLAAAPAGAEPGSGIDSGPIGRLRAAFIPDRLGAPATVTFAVDIDPAPASGPIPLAGVEVTYPSNVDLATSGLGIEACDPAALESQGPTACPPDSKMGQGTAMVEVPFGPYIVHEKVNVEVFAAPSEDGYVHLAILASGTTPVFAQIVLTGVVLPGRLKITIPLIASLPGAPYVSLVQMRASLGEALTYYERVHGHTVSYHPQGIGLPDRCPHGGWKVAARFAFTDGRASHAGTVIPCPRQRPRADGAAASRAAVGTKHPQAPPPAA